MLYEVVPDENNPNLNVKVVVWSNVKALGDNFLNSHKLVLVLWTIKQNFQPDIILLDNCIEFNDSVTNLLSSVGFKNGFIESGGRNIGKIQYKIWYNESYDFRGGRKNRQASCGLEGAYSHSDDAALVAGFDIQQTKSLKTNLQPLNRLFYRG
jgi:hypothetical protein